MAYSSAEINKHVSELQKQGLSGKALENRIYSDAKSKGVSSSQLESAVGWKSGTVNNWTKSNNKSSLSKASSSGGGLLSGALKSNSSPSPSAQKPNNSVSGNSFTTGQINQHIGALRNQGLSGKALESRIYQDAKQNGVSGTQLEAAQGWNTGTVHNWTEQNKLAGLGTAAGSRVTQANAPGERVNSYTADPNTAYGAMNNYWSQLGEQGLSGFDRNYAMYQEADRNGWGRVQMEDAIRDFEQGDVFQWAYQNNLPLLQGANADERRAGAPNHFASAYEKMQAGVPMEQLNLNERASMMAHQQDMSRQQQTDGYRIEGNTLYMPGGGEHTVDGPNAEAMLRQAYGLQGSDLNNLTRTNMPESNGSWLSQAAGIDVGQGGQQQGGQQPGGGLLNNGNTSTSAAGQLDQILNANSALMQRSATQGAQVANSRGLLNSSMAAEAAQGAMIDRATPLAQQDAQYYQNRGINQQQYGFQRGLNEQQYQQNRGLNEQGYQFDMGKMQQQYGFNSQLSSQEADQALNSLYATSTANGWGVMSNNLTDIVGQYSSQLERIQMNPDIEQADKTAMMQQVLEMRDIDIGFQQSLYNELPNYLANTGVFPNR